MKVPKLLIPCLLTVSMAFAQEASSPSPFNSLRGHAYNPYATWGAPSTVGDLVLLPSSIKGKKFAYISPSDELGYTAFDLYSRSTLLGLRNSKLNNPAALVLGYATSGIGIALDLSLSKEWKDSANTSQRTTHTGDNIGVYISVPMGPVTVFANASKLAYDTSSATDYSTIDTDIGLLGSLGSLRYLAYFDIIHTNADSIAVLRTILRIHFGYTALQDQAARVIVGLNNNIEMRFHDKAGSSMKSDNSVRVNASPNFLGEVVLFDNLLAFTGATHTLSFLAEDSDANDDVSSMWLRHSPRTRAFAGIRYQRANWALEAQVDSNPFEAFNGDNIFANFGGFINF